MFCSLSVFRGHSTQEPASVVWNEEQGDLVYSASPLQEPVLDAANTEKTRVRFWRKNAGGWIGRVDISKEEVSGS